MRWWISVVFAAACAAGPKDFGLAELKKALAARNLHLSIKTEMTTDAPETYRIEPYPNGLGARIDGGDLRGLMYGLIEASEQIRAAGKLARVKGEPALPIRAVRLALTSAEFESEPPEWFRGYFEMLALNRFNRITMALDRAPAESDFKKLRALAQTANDYGLDFVIAIPPAMTDLKPLLDACPLVRGVQLAGEAAPFAAVLDSIKAAGRLVTLDLRGALRTPENVKRVSSARVPLRMPIEIEGPLADSPAGVRQALSAADPAGFEIDAPTSADIDLLRPIFSLWGRLGYEPKPEPKPKAVK